MSVVANITSPSIIVPLPPPGTNWLAVIDSALVFLMIGATMGAVTVAMLLALLFFSTANLRRKPVFILNVVALLLGITGAVINIYEEVHTLKYPTIPLSPRVIIAIGTIDGIAPTLVDSILILRVYSVFPPRSTPRIQFIVLMGVPILISIARLINAIIYLTSYARTIHASTGAGGAAVLVTSPLPSVKIEWFLQVFDDLFLSLVFLSRVYRHGMSKEPQTVSEKIKTLFWISASNFVFPVMLGIVQLVIYMAKPKEYLLAVYVEETNFHLNIIGLVFATVWAAEGHWADANDIKDSSTRISTLQFNNNFPGLVSRHRPNRITLSSGSNLTTLQEVHDMVPMNSFPVALDPSKAGLSGIKEGEVCDV